MERRTVSRPTPYSCWSCLTDGTGAPLAPGDPRPKDGDQLLVGSLRSSMIHDLLCSDLLYSYI
jgi:hypothetical protein